MMNKIYSFLLLWLCQMALFAQIGGTDGSYDPSNPPNPDAPVTKYKLTTTFTPAGAGSANIGSSQTYEVGAEFSIYAYSNSGYVFQCWKEGDEVVSQTPSFYYKMPARDVNLRAEYKYDPSSPANPQAMGISYMLNLVAQPAGGGSFNQASRRVEENTTTSVYAYSNNGYEFKGWQLDGEIISTNQRLQYLMPSQNTTLTAVFKYNPSNPGNPGANSWTQSIGEVIADDFQTGSLYDAIYNLTQGNNNAVTQITVIGKMNDNDFGIANNYNNCTLLDLSRTTGLNYVPSYCYYSNSVLTSIALPASIEEVEYMAFYNCENLTAISCYASAPPTVGWGAFEGVQDGCVVYVPAASVSLYQEADGWKDFTILPLASQVNLLEVNLPAGSEDGRYKNMFIELINTRSGQKLRYVVGDRLVYTFNSLMHNTQWNVYLKNAQDVILGKIEEIDIQTEDVSVTFTDVLVPRNITLSVMTPDGADVTSQTSITWMDAKNTYLAQGNSLSGLTDDTEVKYRVSLPQELGMKYVLPTEQTYTVGSSNDLVMNLQALPQATLSGVVRDVTTGQTISGAMVSVSQSLNGMYSKSQNVRTDNSGHFTTTVYTAEHASQLRLTVSASDYISQSLTEEQLTETEGLLMADVSLKSITGATISIGFTYKASAVAGEEVEVQNSYNDYANVSYSVYNETQKRAINEFSAQYPKIVLLEEVNEGDVLQLTATSRKGAFVPVTTTATIDEANRASATFDIVQLGQIAATFSMTDNPAVVGTLYDSRGRLLSSNTYTNASLSFTDLADGKYTLVSMAKSSLFNSIYDLSQLPSTGLTEGVDYVQNEVTVKSGVIAVISNDLVPALDETKLYYTGDNTSFTVNKTQVTAGNYLTLSGHIDFKSAYANKVSDVKLIVDLPEESSFVENSVMVGNGTASYTTEGHRVIIPLDNYADRARFCFIPTDGGDYAPSAYVQFTLGGKEVTQPIGSANYTVKDLSITVPSTVAKPTVPVSGTAIGKSEIEIYDNGILVGQTTALANGFYSTIIELESPTDLSTHEIYARVTTPMGVEMRTESQKTIYDKNAVEVKTVSMSFYNGWLSQNVEVIFDFEKNKANVASYMFYTETDFTFLIDLSYSNIKLIPFVWLHVFTSDGKVRSLRAEYEAKKDRWIAIDRFSGDALPTKVSVTVENMTFDPSDEVTYEVLMDKYIGDIELKETIEGEDGSTTFNYSDQNGDDVASITSYESDLTVDQLVDIYEKEGFVEDELLNDESGYVPEDEDDVLDEEIKVLTEPETGSLVLIGPGGNGHSNVVIIRLVREEDKQESTALISSTITGNWRSFYRTYFDKVNCVQVTEYKRHTEYLDKYVTTITSTLVAHTLFVDYTKLPEGIKIPRKQVIAKLKRVRYSSKRYTKEAMEYSVVPKDCTPPPPPPPPVPPIPPVSPIHDPSGYVYEGVSSNRLQGVTATAYYKENVEDIYGDLHENIVLWNAADYAQENPLFTDENGMYQWDVPQGLWQVKFEKEGYQTTYSEWLPVPPPQLDVNIAMVQDRQPEVTEAHAYEDGVEVDFDKYMLPESLNTDNIVVTKNGVKMEGRIELLDEEVTYEGDNVTYASRVKFVPTDGAPILPTDAIVLTVSKQVKSYAGLQMQESYTQEFDVEKAVRNIAVDDKVSVIYEEERQLLVGAQPADAAVGKKLIVKTVSKMIADVKSGDATTDENGTLELTLDEDGQATITLIGELPGSTALTFALSDANVTARTAVSVLDQPSLDTDAPVASRASGSAVYRGTKVTLSCETKDATIYYTLDGSCPCDEATRLTYKGLPIVITEDVTIRAMAQGRDMYESNVVEFNYTIKKTTSGMELQKGWNWVSHNVADAQNATATFANAVEVKSQTKGLIKDDKYGLVGNLQSLLPVEAYKVKVDQAETIILNGDEFNAGGTAIELAKGWNWIGYPVNQILSLSEAFAQSQPTDGDYILGQSGYAEYIEDEWYGTLETLTPGKGYMYKSEKNNSIKYNISIVSNARARYGHSRVSQYVAPWAVNIYQYPDMMPVTADLYAGEEKVDADVYSVGAFCGTECRGVGKYVKGVLFLSVYGENNETITFLASDNTTNDLYELKESIPFKADNVGSYRSPYSLHIGDMATEIIDRQAKLDVSPTLAHDVITVALPSGHIDRLAVISMSGAPVISLGNLETPAQVNVASLTAGTYIVAVTSEGCTYYKKIIKVN